MPVENGNNQNQNIERKKWEDYTLAEKKESYLKYVVKEIAESIKENRSPFMESVEKFQRAYNPSQKGKPYTSVNSLVLDIAQKKGNYKENAWISLKDSIYLGVSKEERNAIFSNKDIPHAQIHFIKTKEVVPVYELDKDGNKILEMDENGNQKLHKNGEPQYKYKMETKVNPKTNKPYTTIATRTIPIKPTLETRILYNIEEFKTINKNLLKPINEEQEYKNYIRHQDTFDATNAPLIFQDIEKVLYPQTANQILQYMQAQNEDKSYVLEQGFNKTEKIEMEKVVEKGVKSVGDTIKGLEDKVKKLEDVLNKISEGKPILAPEVKEVVKETPKQTQQKTVSKPKAKQEDNVEKSKGKGR